jgi:hypothetical protein
MKWNCITISPLVWREKEEREEEGGIRRRGRKGRTTVTT